MLRKFIAKLRETISPSSQAKKPVEAPVTAKQPSRQPIARSRPRSARLRFRSRQSAGLVRAALVRPWAGPAGPRPRAVPSRPAVVQGAGAARAGGVRPRFPGAPAPGARSPAASQASPAHYATPQPHREAAPPPVVPKMATAFTALGLTDALAYAAGPRRSRCRPSRSCSRAAM
jgi:hypothetical protein